MNRRAWTASIGIGTPGAATPLISSVSLVLFTGLSVYAMCGFQYDGEPVHLSSPLRGGAFYVGQGGNSPLLNYHNTHDTQRYAMDILVLSIFATNCPRLVPGCGS